MRNFLKLCVKPTVLFLIGGCTYYLIEILWRGYSHWTMLVLGGACFLLIGKLNEHLSWNMSLLYQSLIGAGIVTLCEFMTGVVVNIWLGMNVWDYSEMPYNVMGQICLPFTLAWVPISCFAIVLDDYIRHWLFKEEKPHYTIV